MPARRAGPAAAAALASLLFLLPIGLVAATPGGQGTADTVVLEGRVVRGADSVPAAGRTVVLHRVSADSGTAVDSVSAGPDGRFAFRLAPTEGVVHIASARYDDVLYFGPAVHGDRVPRDYTVRVWEAREATVADTVRIRRRTLVLTPSGGPLEVMDVVDAFARSDRTLTPPRGEDGPWWGVELPSGARDVRVLPGGVDGDAIRIADGRARASASVPPRGLRLVLGYRLPEGHTLALGPDPRVEGLEVVVRGRAGEVEVGGLESAGSSTVEGRDVHRWVSRGAVDDTVRVTAAGPEAGSGGVPAAAWIAAGAGVLLLAGAVTAWRAVDPKTRPRDGRA